MKTSSDLEEAIMNAWQTENDLQSIFEGSDIDLSKAENVDRLHNQLIGVRELHNLRMNKLWEIFEEMCHRGVFKPKDVIDDKQP